MIDHHQHALAARDRPFSATAYRPELGIDNTSPASFPANIPLSRGRFLNPAALACTDTTVFERGGCFYDYERQIDALPRSTNTNLVSRLAVALPHDAEAYAELL